MRKYHLRPGESLALRAMQTRRGLKTVILGGPPGTGKTFFAEALAEETGASYLYYLCHHWSSDEELFIGVHVGRVACGVEKPQDAYEYGVLAKAAIRSRESAVVLCLDELDKAPQRVESLLLDFLQHGRVYMPNGSKIVGDLNNLTVVITTNNCRPLQEATLRRGFRVQMGFLPSNVEADIIRKSTGGKMGAIRVICRMANIIRREEASFPSLQEMQHLTEDLAVASTAEDVRLLIQGWLCKEPEDWESLTREMGTSPESILWGEFKR